MKLVLLLAVVIELAISGNKYRRSRRNKNKVNNYSFGDSDSSNCPSFDEYGDALNAAIGEADSSLLQNLYDGNYFRQCNDGNLNTCVNNANDVINAYLFNAGLVSSYNIEFFNEKYGTYYMSADWEVNLKRIGDNGDCPFTMYGVISLFCNDDGNIIEEYSLHNEEQLVAIFVGCTD